VLQGYITASQDLGWPGSPITDSISGGGAVRTLAFSAPGLGVEHSTFVPVGARWELLSWSATLTTSAVAGARQPFLLASTLGSSLWASPSPYVMGAVAAARYNWAPGMPIAATVGTFIPPAGIPIGYILTTLTTIETITAGLDPLDAWGASLLRVREWLEVN
jgi:hypothetical protein